ncbi:1,4-dihydroxy-2-naphthoate octaprenyltransferase [Aquimarina sp. U1-2]|uniref:1,4-dihydroxy-2-naphthoate octaprenyltransferase n=1 Tax=Aquimarina sp. U1-2 TaxID=2823141 RepID=UPI001AEC8A07|nr:1,4-dihydroxy-2-naphthoate octaprenyltransferase [Aquimarina sp. U1-2]MBP2832694.1 1,4-dihydroxy-2-naphthoate octaprenyltransferase [Aquimarina sp. U1-2]
MSILKAWVSAARLRTLPLSISGIIVGSALGTPIFWQTSIFWLALLTTLGLQILSNFANDYGDGIKGTDNQDRVGPPRALQIGSISSTQMLRGIVITACLTFVLAISLIYVSFGKENYIYTIIFFLLGIMAIAASILYTVGKSAYGYRGLGDVFVFVFFGLVSVVGCYFLFTKTIEDLVVLPAITIGLLSTAVLNLNNMRDHSNDKKSNKNTLVVKLGIQNAKMYHFCLVILAICILSIFIFFSYEKPLDLIPLIAFIPLFIHINKVRNTKHAELLDPELKKVALTTFLLAILFSLSQIL